MKMNEGIYIKNYNGNIIICQKNEVDKLALYSLPVFRERYYNSDKLKDVFYTRVLDYREILITLTEKKNKIGKLVKLLQDEYINLNRQVIFYQELESRHKEEL